MPKYAFLTDDWIVEVRRIREEHSDDAPSPPHSVRMNQIITEVPFGDGTVHAHLDTSGDEMKMELEHLEGPDLTITVDYVTAKAILVDGNPQAGMQAFMSGKIKVEGDMTKMMALQQAPADPEAAAIAEKVAKAIQEVTE